MDQSVRELLVAGSWRALLGGIGLAVFVVEAMVRGIPDYPLWVRAFAGAGAVMLSWQGVAILLMAWRLRKAQA